MTKTKGPGPNRYLLPSTIGYDNHDPTHERSPGYSFGSRYSYSTTHGPGPYYLESGLSHRGRANNAGFTLYGRPKRSMWEVAAENSPGPAYNPNNAATDKRTPAYSFGAPYRTTYKSDGPGPNSYSVPSSWGRNTRGALIGGRSTDSKGFAYDHAQTPGPGAYGNPYVNQWRGPAFTIGQRHRGPKNNNITPGPYVYNYETVNPSSPRFSMGIRHHEDVITVADVSD